MSKHNIPYQSNNQSFFIRKIRRNFDALSIDESPHRHEFYEFLYIKSGTGQHEIDGTTYELAEHTFYIISKGQVHNFLFAQEVDGILIRFKEVILPTLQSSKEGFYYNLLFSLHQFPKIKISTADQEFVELLLSRMLMEYQNNPLELHLIQHLMYPLLILMNRYLQKEIDAQDYQQDQYLQFIQTLEKSYKFAHDLNFYADTLGLSTRKLSQICFDKSGKSAKAIISERRLTEAKRLIKYTSLPLKEIAYQLGFKDVGYFCRFFKKSTNMTTTAYKSLGENSN